MDQYIDNPIGLHGVVLNLVSTGTTLFYSWTTISLCSVESVCRKKKDAVCRCLQITTLYLSYSTLVPTWSLSRFLLPLPLHSDSLTSPVAEVKIGKQTTMFLQCKIPLYCSKAEEVWLELCAYRNWGEMLLFLSPCVAFRVQKWRGLSARPYRLTFPCSQSACIRNNQKFLEERIVYILW
jgi:hypothetical protein